MKNIRTKAISLITAALTIAACTIHASAETSYPPGDVNMNGKVEADDALLVLTEYLNVTIMKDESARTFTDEQIALGDVYHPDAQYEGIDVKDANYIFAYYLTHELLHDNDLPMEEFVKIDEKELNSMGALIFSPMAVSYRPGDVNMNGKVDADDANMVLWEYLTVGVMGEAGTFTAEQLVLGNVYRPDEQNQELNVMDAQYILLYFLEHDIMQTTDLPMEEFVRIDMKTLCGL